MGLATFFGCLFTAYGPPLALFITHVAPQAHLVILFIMSAFFWLASMLFASVFWFIIPQMHFVFAFQIPFSVGFQELFRWLYYFLFSKSSRGLNLVATNPNSAYNALEYAFVSGFGFGFMSSLVSFISALAESIGPGFLPCPSCPNVSTYFIYAVTTLLFNMLHIIWMVIAFDSFIKKDWKGPVAVFLYHVAASYLTLFNASSVPSGCAASIILLLVLIAAGALYIWKFILLPLNETVRRQKQRDELLQ